MTKEEFFSSGIIRPKSRGRSEVHEHMILHSTISHKEGQR